MTKAYIFDLFGTLAYYTNGKEIKELVGEDHEHLLVTKLEDSNIAEDKKRKLMHLYGGYDVHLFGDSERIIDRLKKDFRIGMITNIYELTAIKFKDKYFNFLKKFDTITLSCDVGLMKPDYRIFNNTLTELCVNPEEAVMVGDNTRRDIIPAKELGMKTILIDREKQRLEELIWQT